MGYKTILVHVEPTGEYASVRCALSLADRFGALTIGCGCEVTARYVPDPVAAELVTLADAEVNARLKKAKAVFERLAGSQDHRWISHHAAPTDALAQAACIADLIVAAHPHKSQPDPHRHEDLGLLALAAGRPVLITPSGKDYLAADRVLICWNGSREARRAIADALPFLVKASSVLVAQVAAADDLRKTCHAVAEIAESLQRHGARAEGEALIKDERRTFDILRDRASTFGADLLVAGAYGHSRMGERVLGGMTRSLLAQDERFVLLSH